jgi:phosphoglycerol transferase MdoB-like AlkP superfamily enzyme
MKQRLLFLLRTFIFWVVLFIMAKILFLTYEFQMTSQLAPALWFKSIWNGLQMDIAMTSYVIMVFTTLLSFTFFLKGKQLTLLFKIANTLLLVLFLLVIVLDLELYRNWGFHLDTTPFQYLKTPQEAAASTPLFIYLLVTALFSASLYFATRIYKKHILSKLAAAKTMKFYFIPVFLILGGSMIIPARGGFDVSPMNTSFVYYSSNIYANHIAVNPVWNFLYALDHMDNLDRDYDCLPTAEANKRFKTLMKDEGVAPKVLNTPRPNVILIILESFSSDLLEHPEVVPNLTKISQEGLFFDHYYSVAGRSDKGIGAILSGYPAHPGVAVIKTSSKIEKMPNLGKAFKDMGYYDSFYYGGDINFANMNSYLNISRFDRIITKLDFPSKYYGAKWGVHDEYTFKTYFEDLATLPKPFFNAFFTLSSHEPFDVPEKIIKGESTKNKFLNTALYTDKQLGLFMEKLRGSDLWDSTLVIITADHGSNFVKHHKGTDKGRYHIPMIWSGGALTSTGIISKYGSQTDLIATLLGQMNYPADDFIFSKNLLSPDVAGFSYYTYNGGAGFINNSLYQVYDDDSHQFLTNEGGKEGEMPGRVFLQTSYNYFVNK